MTDTDRFDRVLERFLTAEAARADSRGSVDEMVLALTASARPRFALPSRAVVWAFVLLAMLAALALSMAVVGSRPRINGLALTTPTDTPTPARTDSASLAPSPVPSDSPSLAPSDSPSAVPSDSPSGLGLLVYARAGEMHIYDPDTGSDQVVYREEGIEGATELWSEDGSRIVFNFGFAHNVAADGTDLQSVTPTQFGVWSPDGQLYASERDAHILVSDAAGSVVQTLDMPKGITGADGLAWAHDGKSIAATLFTCTSASTCEDRKNGFLPNPTAADLSELWVFRFDGRKPRRLVDPQTSADAVRLQSSFQGGNWSPDDSQLALGRLVSCNPDTEGCAWAIDLFDSGTGVQEAEIPNAFFAGWSPDGLWLAYEDGTGAIGIVHPDGSGRSTLTSNGALPVWSADGSRIAYFTGAKSQTGDVHIVNIDGSDDHIVFSGTNNFDWQHFGGQPAQ